LIRDGLREARPGHGTAFAQADHAPASRNGGTAGRGTQALRTVPCRGPQYPRCPPRRPSSPLPSSGDVPGNRPLAPPEPGGERRHGAGIWPLRSSPACRAPISACGPLWSRSAKWPGLRIAQALQHLTTDAGQHRRRPCRPRTSRDQDRGAADVRTRTPR
jgi:hypothetical protein